MKRIVLYLILLVLLVTWIHSQDYDIRSLRWGMPYDQVKQIEGLENELFKEEDLLEVRVEVNFGFDYRGLYAVIYSARGREFAFKADEKLRKKYGAPSVGLDYSFIMQSKDLLKHYPDVTLSLYEKNDPTLLENVKSEDERKLIVNLLTKQSLWIYGNTAVLLLKSSEISRLSYWSKTHQEESKKKFTELLAELKKLTLNKKTEAKDDSEKL